MEELGMEREWSPRTFARFKQGMEMLEEACNNEEEMAVFIQAATRPNGKLNVSKLQEVAFKCYVVRVDGASQSDAEVAWVIWKATH